MSGITPILDTLLHQVLGKPVDLASARELNEPVRPMLPGTAPQAVHSDSRLDPRAPTVAEPARAGSRGTAAAGAPPAGDSGTSSTLTHFSHAARAIADVLARFPAPPSVLKAPTPLLLAGETPQPAELAARLKSSVDSSGLFYESHLQRWYKGSLPRVQLEREPQMQRVAAPELVPGQAPTGTSRTAAAATGPLPPSAHTVQPPAGTVASDARPGPVPAAAGRPATAVEAGTGPRPVIESPTYSMPQIPTAAAAQPGARPAPAAVPPGAAAPAPGTTPPGPGATPPGLAPPVAAPTAEGERSGGVSESSARELPAAAVHEAGRARAEPAVSETLQAVVRHQLEMLAMPVLRWEGDVWSGVFMALMIQLPAAQQDWQAPTEAPTEQPEEEAAWRTELVLEVANLGEIRVSLQLSEQRLAMTLASPDPALTARLDANREELEARLSLVGFENVVLNLAVGDQHS